MGEYLTWVEHVRNEQDQWRREAEESHGGSAFAVAGEAFPSMIGWVPAPARHVPEGWTVRVWRRQYQLASKEVRVTDERNLLGLITLRDDAGWVDYVHLGAFIWVYTGDDEEVPWLPSR